MTARIVAAAIGIGATLALASVAAGEPARELHGSADAFAAPGVALAWAVSRGTDEASTFVAIRIVADSARYRAVSAAAVDPFTQKRVPLLPITATTRPIDVRVPRGQFAEYPRTEFRFDAVAAAAPDLVVFYAGVPDTTPEFVSGEKLAAYLGERIARATAEGVGK